MNTADFAQLEKLLGKLRLHLDHKFCIVPEVIQDAYHLAIYDEAGNIKNTAVGAFLEDAATKVLSPSLMNKINERVQLHDLIKRAAPYIRDLQSDNFNDPGAGIRMDYELSKLDEDIQHYLQFVQPKNPNDGTK